MTDADTQQVRHEAGILDIRFLEQCFQPVVEFARDCG